MNEAWSRTALMLGEDAVERLAGKRVAVFGLGGVGGHCVDALARSGKAGFVRSVFLQGLVFMDPDHLHPQMTFAAPALRKFRGFCEEFALSPAVLAMSFVLSLPGVTSLVLGCERREQVEANAALIDQPVRLTETQMDRLRAAFEESDPHLINPGTWYNSEVVRHEVENH